MIIAKVHVATKTTDFHAFRSEGAGVLFETTSSTVLDDEIFSIGLDSIVKVRETSAQ